MLGPIRRVHMVGIGGIGMSSIAEVLLARGYRVSGSDLRLSDTTERLASLGATIYEGHAPENVEGADVVVHSSAVKADDNPETLEAKRRRIPRIRRAEMLGELMRMKYGVGIAGTHGKTTTTTMVGLVVREGDFDPTIIVGGKVDSFESNAVSGEGDLIVIEADEYDRTFLRLTPVLAVVTNVEIDHLDTYADEADIQGAFVQYANSVPFFGAAIVCLDDAGVSDVLNQIQRRIVTYGTSRQASIRAEGIVQDGPTTRFRVVHRGDLLGEVHLKAAGLHNVRNALAAVAVGLELDIDFDKIAAGLANYAGVRRRFELKGEAADILVMDDYAHHPTEVRATLEAVAGGWPGRRIVTVFQPHLYSRTRDFQDDFARAFFNTDVLVLTDIFGAREQPIEGVTGQTLADLARRYGHRQVHFVQDKKNLPDYLAGLTEPGDLVLTMGAGDVWRYGEQYLRHIEGVASDAGTSKASEVNDG
ncbi:MAG: UDP-N-acetylmuramate--L-alanine ligase [Bacteroidota bacterium]